MKWITRVSIAQLLLLGTLALAQNISAPQLGPQVRQADFPVLSSTDYVRHRWEGTFLVSTRLHASPSVPVALLHDKNGTLARSIVVWLKGAAAVEVADGALSADGSFIVSGGTTRADGKMANFLAKVDPNGSITKVIQTTPYIAYYVRPAPDGTVWTLGVERDENLRGKKEFAVLRQFSFEKGNIAQMLPSESIPYTVSRGKAMIPWYASFPGGINLGNGGRTIGFYSARTSEWITVDLASLQIVRQTVGSLRPGVEITGVAYTDTGKVFASLFAPGEAASLSGLAELKPTSSTNAQWVMVGGTVAPSDMLGDPRPFATLLGSSGTQLVYRSESYPGNGVAWAREP